MELVSVLQTIGSWFEIKKEEKCRMELVSVLQTIGSWFEIKKEERREVQHEGGVDSNQ